jgi:hypothetical protein
MSKPEVIGSSVGSAQINTLLLIEREHFNSGEVKGTITGTVRYHFVSNDVVSNDVVSNDVRRHRLISISYISLLPCHGTARGNGREPEGARGMKRYRKP